MSAREFFAEGGLQAERLRLAKILDGSPFSYEVDSILMHVLGLDVRSKLLTFKSGLSEAQARQAEAIANDCKNGEPLQYAMGSACFYGYDFAVDGRVLIPRFDTELLAEQAIIAVRKKEGEVKVLDLCTGSGAIAITIAKETSAVVTAVDISQDALDVARQNAKNLHADVEFIQSDMFANVSGAFDVIVSNPPYIPTADIEELDASVKDYEPRLALNGGSDGLDFYKLISNKYKDYLKEGGVLMMEVGIGQGADVAKLFDAEAQIIKDYNSPPIDRVVIVKN